MLIFVEHTETPLIKLEQKKTLFFIYILKYIYFQLLFKFKFFKCFSVRLCLYIPAFLISHLHNSQLIFYFYLSSVLSLFFIYFLLSLILYSSGLSYLCYFYFYSIVSLFLKYEFLFLYFTFSIFNVLNSFLL